MIIFLFQKHGSTEYQSYTVVDISFDLANIADNLQDSETAMQVFGLGMCGKSGLGILALVMDRNNER